MVTRIFKHLFSHPWQLSSAFPRATLDAIESAIKTSETRHRGELRFVIETALPVHRVARGHTSHQQAIEVFSQLKVWDTEENIGVLIYVLLAEHKLEILADRGLMHKVDQHEWDAIAQTMQTAYRKGEFLEGSLAGIEAITRLLERHFPPEANKSNELPDRPLIIRR
ncbi:MAG: TPM domain-containing protein [Thiobacillaceae bacterium]|jgi:uncharacterized membrane protein